jgi:hypothetical protein
MQSLLILSIPTIVVLGAGLVLYVWNRVTGKPLHY